LQSTSFNLTAIKIFHYNIYCIVSDFTGNHNMTKTQDLLLCQLLHTANLCWLRKRGLPSFNFSAVSDAGHGTLELSFGIPSAHAEAHQTLLEDWMETAKKAERLHILLLLLSEHKKHSMPEHLATLWHAEGSALQHELFNTALPGVYTSSDEAIEALKS
jgi:hypothetical protein